MWARWWDNARVAPGIRQGGRGARSAAGIVVVVVAASTGLAGLAACGSRNQSTSSSASPVTVPTIVSGTTAVATSAAAAVPVSGDGGTPITDDTVGYTTPVPSPSYDPVVVDKVVRRDPHVVEAIGDDFEVFNVLGVPDGIVVTVKTPTMVVVPRSPYAWAWPVDQYGAPIIDGDATLRPALQYFQLQLDADMRLRTIVPALGETVEPGTAPTRPQPSIAPPVTLVSPAQVAAAEQVLRTDPTITHVIGADFTVLTVGAGKASEDDPYGVSFQLQLAGPMTIPAGVPVVGGGDERTPGTIGPSATDDGPVRYIGVVLRPDNTVWWYFPIPDELGAHYADQATTTSTG